MKRFAIHIVALSVLAFSAVVGRADTTSLVYQTTVSLPGVTQGPGNIVKVSLAGNTIVNLARGRAFNAVVPANEVLATAVSGEFPDFVFKFIVFDKTTGSNLVTVADVSSTDKASAGAANTAVMSFLDIQSAGSSSNKFNSGTLVLAGKTSVIFSGPTSNTTFNLSASLTGVVDLTADSADATILVSKGKAGIKGKPIAVLIEP